MDQQETREALEEFLDENAPDKWDLDDFEGEDPPEIIKRWFLYDATEQVRLVEMFRSVLDDYDYDYLISFFDQTRNIPKLQAVVMEMAGRYLQNQGLEDLLELWDELSGYDASNQITILLKTTILAAVADCDDLDQLVSFIDDEEPCQAEKLDLRHPVLAYEMISRACRLLETRLNEETDIRAVDSLVEQYEECKGDEDNELMAIAINRFAALVAKITDMQELLSLHHHCEEILEPLIVAQMRKVIHELDETTDPPEWFMDELWESNIPDELRQAVLMKVQDFFNRLS